MKMDADYILFAQINTPFIPETDWLVSQYYPKEIIREKYGTGYYTLGKKGTTETDPVSYITETDFEAPTSGWSYHAAGLDTMLSYSGRYSNKLDSVNIYSSTFTTRVSALPKSGRKYFRISLHAMNGPGADALIVYEVIRKDKTAVWYATHLNDMIAIEDQWSKVCMIKYPYERLRNDDVLKIYVWNNSKGNAWIDAFKVELAESNSH